MPIDLERDARRLRLGFLILGLLLAMVIGALAFSGLQSDWRNFQGQAREKGILSAEKESGIIEILACSGESDRCATCHLGIERENLGELNLPLPLRPHSASMAGHLKGSMGCSVCHGGTSRGLSVEVAHALPGFKRKDPLFRPPHIQASCARCHVPGDQPGMGRLVHGANLYLELGCLLCHPLSPSGVGGFDFGPDLQALGRKSPEYLETSLIEPTANFSQSTMPSFKSTFESNRSALEDLIVFLESLVLPEADATCNLRQRIDVLAGIACETCHAQTGGQAVSRFRHRCLYILQRREELSCPACHRGEIPEVDSAHGGCPLLRQHLPSCVVCHRKLSAGPLKATQPDEFQSR